MIRLDRSPSSIVIVCSDCHYRGVDNDRSHAWQRGLAHVRAVHPDDPAAVETARRTAARNDETPRP
jgi:hypothetical protein